MQTPEKPKSIDEWADTRRFVDNMSQDMEAAAMTEWDGPGIVYEGGFIEGPLNDIDGHYHLLIGRTEWSSTSLERLEGILYAEWVMGELYGLKVL